MIMSIGKLLFYASGLSVTLLAAFFGAKDLLSFQQVAIEWQIICMPLVLALATSSFTYLSNRAGDIIVSMAHLTADAYAGAMEGLRVSLTRPVMLRQEAYNKR